MNSASCESGYFPVPHCWVKVRLLGKCAFLFLFSIFQKHSYKCKCVLYSHYIEITSHVKSLAHRHDAMCAANSGDDNVTQPILFFEWAVRDMTVFHPTPSGRCTVQINITWITWTATWLSLPTQHQMLGDKPFQLFIEQQSPQETTPFKSVLVIYVCLHGVAICHVFSFLCLCHGWWCSIMMALLDAGTNFVYSSLHRYETFRWHSAVSCFENRKARRNWSCLCCPCQGRAYV